MTHIVFEDPNISTTGTFAINGFNVTAPIFTSSNVSDIMRSVQANSGRYFASNPAPFEAIARSLALWTNMDYGLRQKALPILADITQFSQPNIVCYGLKPLERVRFAPEQILELPKHLTQLVETGQYRRYSEWGEGYLKGYGIPKVIQYDSPKTIVQILAGNVVGPPWLTASLGAVAGSSQLIKLPHRDLVSFMFYLQTLGEVDPDFRKTIACGYFASIDNVNDQLFKNSGVIIAMGSDETMDIIRGRLSQANPKSRLIPHGFRIGFQAIGKEYATSEVAELAAWGIAAYDGNGCFSPANLYIETGGQLTPQQFAEELASHMQSIAVLIPPKKTIAAAERVTSYRNAQMQRRLLGENIHVAKSTNTDYTIVIDNENPLLEPTCQERTVMVKPIDDIRHVPEYVKHLAQNLQTVGLCVPTDTILEVSDELCNVGVTNVKIVGMEHTIDIIEPHDGLFDIAQMFLSDGVRWTSIGFSDTDKALDDALRVKNDCLRSLPA